MALKTLSMDDWILCRSSVDPPVVDDLQSGISAIGKPVAEDDKGGIEGIGKQLPPKIVENDDIATIEKTGKPVGRQGANGEQS